MNGFNVRVTGKVPLVERQDAFHAVYPHSGCQARIVNLSARHIVDNEQSPPFLVDGQTIRQQSQIVFKQPGTAVGFGGSQPISIAVEWTGASIPEFRNVLGRVAEHCAALKDSVDCGNYERIIVIIRFHPAKQNVAVRPGTACLPSSRDPRRNSLA